MKQSGVINLAARFWPCLALLAAMIGASVVLAPAPAAAQTEAAITPDIWQGGVLRPKPDLSSLQRLRFVTDSDYPPFHYFDEEGVLTGFNVDLAKAICDALVVECDVQPVSWDQLFGDLANGDADAAIASIRIDAETLRRAEFTERYYATPGRFVARRDSELNDIRPETLAGKTIGVVKGTSHQAYLKMFFRDAAITPFDTAEDARAALKDGEIDLVFGDGIGLTFWLNGVMSEACCEFRGGPFLDAKYFGEGIGIAVKRGNRKLVRILNYALEIVHDSGRYEELFLRYFPMNFF